MINLNIRNIVKRLSGVKPDTVSYIRSFLAGSLYRITNSQDTSDLSTIKAQIDNMRALVTDSQIATALSYYATDATVPNSNGQIIWATPIDSSIASTNASEIINSLFERWNINDYIRDHILELATIGNLYIPTTDLYKDIPDPSYMQHAYIGNNTIAEPDFDIIPSTKLDPEDVIHLYQYGKPKGYVVEPSHIKSSSIIFPNSSIIHFSLGGLLGNYKIQLQLSDKEEEYDIKFSQPLLERAVQPTRTLNLLENALVLSSLCRTVKFINIECGNAEEEEIDAILLEFKNMIEQQLSLNTNNGDIQSYINPQSPNNLIYVPKINGEDPITITDLNMSDATEEDSKLLQYYQDKKLSVLGIPKEAMNFSSNEGLGGAGSVLSQRSALYANVLERIKTSYINGWKEAINTYFTVRGMSGMVNKFQLNMSDIITEQSTITFDKRDSALGQASSAVDLLQTLGVTNQDSYKTLLSEILKEAFDTSGADVNSWNIKVGDEEEMGATGELDLSRGVDL